MNCSIIQKSQLEGALRLDAEYYQPEYLDAKKILNNIKNIKSLQEVANITCGPAYSSGQIGKNFNILLAKIGDVTNKIGVDDWEKISEKEFAKFNSKKIENLDILMTMTGDPPDVGKCNLIKISGNKILAFNQRVAKLTPKISPYYLFAYLSIESVRLQSERVALGIRQRNVSINDLRNIKVVIPSQDFIIIIEKFVKQFLEKTEDSKNLYHQAEELLLEELGLKDFKAEEKLSCVVNLSDAKSANRIDAEYFNSETNRMLEKISRNKLAVLGDLVDMQKGVEIGAETYREEGKLFIRVSSVFEQELIDKDQKYLSDELYQKYKKDFQPQVGEILLTKDATPGVAYVIKEPVGGIICGGIMRLKLKKDIEPEYLSLCINSIIGETQVERDAGGSIIAHWKPEQIKNLQIPILPKPTQQKIADLVRRSHAARQKAKQLLAEAKREVEEMIENKN